MKRSAGTQIVNKSLWLVGVLGVTVGATVFWGQTEPASAQRGPGAQNAPRPRPGGPGGPAMRLRRLTMILGLTEAQRAQIKTIMENTAKSAKTIRESTSLSPTEKRTQLKSLHEETQKKIRALLTPEQQQKFDKFLEEAKKRRRPGGPAPE